MSDIKEKVERLAERLAEEVCADYNYDNIPSTGIATTFESFLLDAFEALERSRIALDDWLNIHASDHCDAARVAEARARVNERGTIAYIAEVQKQNRAALALLETKR